MAAGIRTQSSEVDAMTLYSSTIVLLVRVQNLKNHIWIWICHSSAFVPFSRVGSPWSVALFESWYGWNCEALKLSSSVSSHRCFDHPFGHFPSSSMFKDASLSIFPRWVQQHIDRAYSHFQCDHGVLSHWINATSSTPSSLGAVHRLL